MTTENFLKNAIKWLVFATLFTPLIVSGSTLFPYVFGKAITFQILIEVMLVAYLCLLYINRQRTGEYQYLPKLNLLTWSLIIFFVVLIFNTIFSVDAYYSFWSKQERMDGLFNLFHFFAFTFVLSSVIKDKNSWLQILNVSLIVSFIASLHALGQAFGLFFTPYGSRVTATLGNAAFLATYLLFNIFFAFFLFFQTKNLWLRFWYSSVFVFEIIILLLTYTRGAILGLLAGFLLFLFGYVIFAPAGEMNIGASRLRSSKTFSKKKLALVLMMFIIITWSALFAFRSHEPIKNNPILNRITDVSFQIGTGKTRIISWGIGLKAFLERPIFGWGQENYYVAFNKHINPIFFTYSGETFDRAHNKMIDLLVMNGVLGFFAYLAVFISASLLLFLKRKENFINVLILVSLLGAYFIQNFVLFDMPISYLMFFLFLGLILFALQEKAPTEQLNKNAPKDKRKFNSPTISKYLIVPAILIIISFLWIGNIKPLLASRSCIRGQAILGSNVKNDKALDIAISNFKKSIDYNTFTNPETRKTMAQLILSVGNVSGYSNQKRTEAMKFTAEELEQGIKEMPFFLDYYTHLADIYHQLATIDKSYLAKSEQALNNLVNLYPDVPYIQYKLIVNQVLAGNYNQAVQIAQKTVALNPRLSASHWYLAISYYYLGELKPAKETAEKALELGYSYSNNLSNLFFLTQLYEQLREYNKVIAYYQQALQISPNDPQIKFGLAKAYKEEGQKEKARELAQQLLKEVPEAQAKEVAEFLVSLDNLFSNPKAE